MHQSTTPSLSQTIWPRWASRQFPHPPYSADLVLCDCWSFPKLRGCRYETIEEMKEAVMKVIDTLTQEDFPWGLEEVVGMVEQVHCSGRRLLRKGLEFHVCTINKSAHTKKVRKLIQWSLYMYIQVLALNNLQGLICHKSQLTNPLQRCNPSRLALYLYSLNLRPLV